MSVLFSLRSSQFPYLKYTGQSLMSVYIISLASHINLYSNRFNIIAINFNFLECVGCKGYG